MADYSDHWATSAPRDVFSDDWYCLGFTKRLGGYECGGCFTITYSYKEHHETCDKAIIRERKTITRPK